MPGLGGEYARHDGRPAQDSGSNSKPCGRAVHPQGFGDARFRRIGPG